MLASLNLHNVKKSTSFGDNALTFVIMPAVGVLDPQEVVVSETETMRLTTIGHLKAVFSGTPDFVAKVQQMVVAKPGSWYIIDLRDNCEVSMMSCEPLPLAD